MPAYIHTIKTATPPTAYAQPYARDFMKRHVARSRVAERAIHRIYTHSGIDQRHSVIREFTPGAPSGPFFDAKTQQLCNPDTQTRNQLYTVAATELLQTLPGEALGASPFRPADVTHLITVSCTGFFAPGPDWVVMNALGLASSVSCFHIGFMGCYAAFPALRLAEEIVTARPESVVLIACVELCTLHLQFTEQTDALLSASLFADGAAVALVSGRPPPVNRPAWRIRSLTTARTAAGAEDMKWSIGNHGFDMTLSTRVPQLIRDHLPDVLRHFAAQGVSPDIFQYWAVHPGGRAILDAVQQTFELDEARLAASRETLRDFGNMSSATIWFVLEKLVQRPAPEAAAVLMMAFGPGLTIESGHLEWLPAKE